MNPPLYAWTGATQHFNENQYHLVRAVILQNGDKPGLNVLSILGSFFNLCIHVDDVEDDTGVLHSTVNIGPNINLFTGTDGIR